MIARFERSAWMLVVMIVLLVGITVFSSRVADAQDAAETPFDAATDLDMGGEAAHTPPAVARSSPVGNNGSQLPGAAIALLVLGIAIFSAWKLPMSHETGGYPSTEREGAREWDDPPEPAQSGQGYPGAASGPEPREVVQGTFGARCEDPPQRGHRIPSLTNGTGTAPSTSEQEVPLEALVREVEILRRVVEEQEQRLVTAEDENSRLRRLLEGTPSLTAGSNRSTRRFDLR